VLNQVEDAYQHFCEERFKLISNEELKQCLSSNQIRFPEIFSDYIHSYNGGWFSEPALPGLDAKTGDRLTLMYGINAGTRSAEMFSLFNVSFHDYECGRAFFPIGYTMMGGMILLGLAAGNAEKIFLKPASSSQLYLLSSNIIKFFNGLQTALKSYND